jgi:hypothetical protein
VNNPWNNQRTETSLAEGIPEITQNQLSSLWWKNSVLSVAEAAQGFSQQVRN